MLSHVIGMIRYNLKERPAPTGVVKYRFDCQNIRIAVVGSQPRVGVTTAAISLCHWLQCVGAMACYVEDNESRVLPIFA